MCYFVDKSIYFFTRDGDFQWTFTFYSLFSLNFHLWVKIQFGHFIENDTIEIQNDTIELSRRGEDALFFRHQMAFSAEKIIVWHATKKKITAPSFQLQAVICLSRKQPSSVLSIVIISLKSQEVKSYVLR